MKIDFHLHTMSSPDSITKPADLIKKSTKLGIIPAVTDHDSIKSHAAMRSLKARFIPGEEISTDQGDLVGLYLNELIPPKISFQEALDKIHEQGGVAYLPHMYDYRRSTAHVNEKGASKVDIVEVFNARCVLDEYNRKARAFAEKHNLLQAAGSDSHLLWEFGRTYTELPDFDLDNPKELLKALLKAKLVTKKTPFPVRIMTKLLLIGNRLTGTGSKTI